MGVVGGGGQGTVIVVGGGIAGAFAAYFLARAGVATTLVERGEIGGQASGKNPGGLNPLYGAGIPGPLQALALESFQLHLDNWGPIGGGFGARRKQRLNLAVDDDDLAALARMKESYDATPGFSARWLDPTEIRAMEPRIGPEIVGGLLAEGDGRVDPGPYTRAVAGAAEGLGGTILNGDVRGFESDGSRVTGVRVDGAVVACDRVVVATGAWCAEPAGWLGVELPVEPLKGELLLAEADTVPVDLAWRDAAVYNTPGDHVWLGGTEDRVGFDDSVTESARASILERVGRFVPALRDARVVRQTAGLRPLTPDGMPVIGMLGGWDNVCVLLGGGRKGMLFGAGMGRAAADLLTAGTTALSIAPCSPERFSTLVTGPEVRT